MFKYQSGGGNDLEITAISLIASSECFFFLDTNVNHSRIVILKLTGVSNSLGACQVTCVIL